MNTTARLAALRPAPDASALRPSGDALGLAAIRCALRPTFDPCDAMIGCAIASVTGHDAPRVGLVSGIGRGFFGEPVALVLMPDGTEREAPSIGPADMRGVGWRFASEREVERHRAALEEMLAAATPTARKAAP